MSVTRRLRRKAHGSHGILAIFGKLTPGVTLGGYSLATVAEMGPEERERRSAIEPKDIS